MRRRLRFDFTCLVALVVVSLLDGLLDGRWSIARTIEGQFHSEVSPLMNVALDPLLDNVKLIVCG